MKCSVLKCIQSAEVRVSDNNQVLEDGTFPKARHVFGFLALLGFALVYAMRVNLSVAIVAMVNQSALAHENISLDGETECPFEELTWKNRNSSGDSNPGARGGEFDWDEATQGLVLGCFFYGYVLTQIPGGRLAERFGGKTVYGFGVFFTSVFTLLTPLAARFSLNALILVRVLTGMGEGVTYSTMHSLLSRWIPPLERGQFAAVVYAGSNIGTMFALPLAGWFCTTDFLGGWPLAFYVFGASGLVWLIFWYMYVFDTPAVHPRISPAERSFIEKSLKIEQSSAQFSNDEEDGIPWGSILRSGPVWAIIFTQCGQTWTFYMNLTEMPTYMNNILHFSIQSNALFSALPYLTSWIVGILCSIFADWLLSRNYISQKNSYRLWNSVSAIFPSLGLLGVSYVGCRWGWVMVMLAGVGSLQGAWYSAHQVNHISLSSKFAGTLYGLTSTLANLCGFLAPYTTGLIINGRESIAQWHLVFILAASINLVGNLVYVTFVSAEEQNWSKKRVSSTASSA